MGEFERITPRIPVADLQRRDALGFRVPALWPRADPTFALIERDEVAVGLVVGETPQIERGPELCVRVTDAEAVHDALRDSLTIEWGPEVYSYGCREFAVRDPDGYLVIFTEPTDDAPTTAEPS
jgi:catechol 2,3-dioxygenase-like lactoylglutathione lyase family enzyme